MRGRGTWFAIVWLAPALVACAGPRRACCPCPCAGPYATAMPGTTSATRPQARGPHAGPVESGDAETGLTAFGPEDGRSPGRTGPAVTPGPTAFDATRALSDRIRGLGVPPPRSKADHALYDAWSSILRPRNGRLETRVTWLTDARNWAIRARGERPTTLAADRWDEGCRQLADLYAILGGALAQYQQVRWKWEEGAIGIMAVSGSGMDGGGEKKEGGGRGGGAHSEGGGGRSGGGGGRSGGGGGHSEGDGHADEGGGSGGRSGGGRSGGGGRREPDEHSEPGADDDSHDADAGDEPPARGPGGGEPGRGRHSEDRTPERRPPSHPTGRPADDDALEEPDADVDLAEAVLQYRRTKEETIAQARQKQLARAREIADGIETGLETIRQELHAVQSDTVTVASTLLAAESRRLEEATRDLPEDRRAEAGRLLDEMYVATLLLEGAKDQAPSRFGSILRQSWLRPRKLLMKLLSVSAAEADTDK